MVRACLNRGTVGYLHIGYNIGGIVGSQTGYVEGCVNYGPVYARKEGGGIVGQMEPSSTLLYSQDTLQELGGELETLQTLVNRACDDASAAGSSLSNQLNDLQSRITGARNAVDTLLDQTKNGVSLSTQTIKTDLSALINGSLSGSENNQGNQHWDLDVTLPTPDTDPTAG